MRSPSRVPWSTRLGIAATACAAVLAAPWPAGGDEVRPVAGTGGRLGVGRDRFRTSEEAGAVRTAWIDDARYRRGPARSLQLDFDPGVYPRGALGLEVPPLRASEGIALWAHAEACGARLSLRLWEADGDRWEHPPVPLDFTGWREFRLDQTTTTFVPKHRTRQDWHRIQQLLVVLEGAPCRLYLGDLRVVPRSRAGGGKTTP